MLNLLNRKENVSMFESFSDLALCTLAVSLLLVALLAINVTQRISVKIHENQFSKGTDRPALYLACSVPDFSRSRSREYDVERALFGSDPYVVVHLLDAGFPQSSGRQQAGKGSAAYEDRHLAQRFNFPLYHFLMLAPGIDLDRGVGSGGILPVAIPADRKLVYDGFTAGTSGIHTGPSGATQLLDTVWPAEERPIDSDRLEAEGKAARTRIYVETHSKTSAAGEEHSVVIGHCSYKLPEALEDGSLAWLGDFMADAAEIVYLGETWSDAGQQTSKRIRFFEEAGYAACADAYRNFLFPREEAIGDSPKVSELRRMGFAEGAASKKVRWAQAQQTVSAALINGSLSRDLKDVLPPLLVFPDAWKSYVAACVESNNAAPEWFYRDFLDVLGFDRMVMELPKKVEFE